MFTYITIYLYPTTQWMWSTSNTYTNIDAFCIPFFLIADIFFTFINQRWGFMLKCLMYKTMWGAEWIRLKSLCVVWSDPQEICIKEGRLYWWKAFIEFIWFPISTETYYTLANGFFRYTYSLTNFVYSFPYKIRRIYIYCILWSVRPNGMKIHFSTTGIMSQIYL